VNVVTGAYARGKAGTGTPGGAPPRRTSPTSIPARAAEVRTQAKAKAAPVAASVGAEVKIEDDGGELDAGRQSEALVLAPPRRLAP